MPLNLPYQPDDAYDVSHKPRTRRLQFGDGEEQRAPMGLNHNLGTWSVAFVEKPGYTIKVIFDFLVARKGVEPFYFRPADLPISEPPKLVVCEEWNKKYIHTDAVQSLNCTFREVVR